MLEAPKGFAFSGLKRTNLMAFKIELPISYKEKLRLTSLHVDIRILRTIRTCFPHMLCTVLTSNLPFSC